MIQRARRRHAIGVLAALAALLLVAACGGEETAPAPEQAAPAEEPAPPAETTIEIPADPDDRLAFTESEITAPAGTVTLVMENPSSLPHDVAIRGDGIDVQGDVVGTGGTSTVTAELEPGTYTVYCSVPGHEEGGMVATLTVTG